MPTDIGIILVIVAVVVMLVMAVALVGYFLWRNVGGESKTSQDPAELLQMNPTLTGNTQRGSVHDSENSVYASADPAPLHTAHSGHPAVHGTVHGTATGIGAQRRGSAHDSENSLYVSAEPNLSHTSDVGKQTPKESSRVTQVYVHRPGSPHDSENSLYEAFDNTASLVQLESVTQQPAYEN